MKYLRLTCIFIFFACLAAVGQVNQIWYKKGKVLYAVPVAGIDSVTYGQFLSADTFFIVIDRASRRIVYDTVDVHVPGMVYHDTIHTTHTVHLKPGRRIGVFSVAKDKQVSFSQGNLQYVQNQNVWKFADQQYEYIGADNVKDGELANKIDLFGWSANNTTAPFGVSASTKAADYSGDFVDWGVNEINIDAPNTWRTLSQEEWGYIFESRKNAKQLYSKGSIDGVRGMIVLPDDWVLPEGLHFTAAPDNLTMDLDINIYTRAQWQKMEEAGAVFLCPTGRRDGLNIGYLVEYGGYWSSSRSGSNRVKHLYFNYQSLVFNTNYNSGDQSYGYNGRAVRLVHDTIVPPPAPCETFEVNGVKFNMMCVEGGTFMMGAASDAHQVTLSDYYIGETEDTQSLWLAVMGGELPPRQEIIGDEYPVADITMEDCRRFVERLTELTGRHFRIPTEAEWEYAARGGKKSKGYKYSGSDDITEVAWYSGNFTEYRPQIVKQYKPNELGIYDMSGNVCEWVNDWYAPYNLYPQINPTGASIYSNSKLPYIHRGGCWTYAPAQCQPERRTSWSHKSANGIGLRLVMSDEEPFKMVYVNDTTRIVLRPVKGEKYNYYIGETEVTYALWKAVMETVLGVEETDNKPVSRVSWDDCQKFIAKLNELTGLHFRLPTEAEWEYVARGGSRSNGYMFAGSNDIDSVGWYMINSDSTDHCVAQLMSNELGIYDMTGNVWEWCQDYYDVNQTMHVVKSGSWFDAATACRIDARTGRAANYKSFIGLRLVLDAHQYVDLGLSVKWATFNLGASAPEDYGDYFAWGEVEPKDIYSWATYKLCNGTSSSLTKYCSDSNYGKADYKTTLETEDDAAYVNWGGDWRMPTETEWTELRQKCTWQKTTINGVTGYRVTAKNGNSIFLPRAGLRMNKVEYATDSVGYYASSTHIPNFKKEDYAYYMLMYNNAIERSNAVRYYGLTIRPVYDAPKVK